LARFDSLDHNRAVAADLAKVRARARTEVSKALAAAARPVAERMADYLLAAREALLRPEPDCETVAAARKLDAALLHEWLSAMLGAARDRDDPLHAWALVAADPPAQDEKRLAELLRPVVEDMRRREAAAAPALKNAQVVIDYGKSAPADWMPDGAAFGPGPARPGDVRLSGGLVRFVERGAAEYDRAFDVLRLAPGAETDPGALGRVTVRSGRTVCTPTFKLTTGKVY